MKFTIKKNVNSFYKELLIIFSDESYLKSAEKFTNSFTYFLEEIIKTHDFPEKLFFTKNLLLFTYCG